MKIRSKTIKIAAMTFTISVLFSFSAWCNDCMDISADVFENNKRPFVCFPHDTHNENAGIEDCAVCHHVYEDGKLMEEESSEDITCAECHTTKGDSKHMELITRYHDRCRGCHLELEKGPLTCGECHKK
ncbi:acidic tetraheme cytochrome c3 TmcA [Desulfocicer niacini]